MATIFSEYEFGFYAPRKPKEEASENNTVISDTQKEVSNATRALIKKSSKNEAQSSTRKTPKSI